MIPEISGPAYLKKRMERAWGRAEREWRKEYQKQVTLLPIIFWTVYRALFRELPGKDVPLDRDAVEEFEDFVNSEEIQKAIDQVIDVCAMVESGAPRLVRETQGHHLPATEGKRGPRGPYQLPLERRLELIRFVWDHSGAFTDIHLVFGALGYEPESIEWRRLWERWNAENPGRPMRSPGQLRDEFRRVTNKTKYADTVREFFCRLDRELRALASKDAAGGKSFADSAAMMYTLVERFDPKSEGESK